MLYRLLSLLGALPGFLLAFPVSLTVTANGTTQIGSPTAIPFNATGNATTTPFGNASFSATGQAILPPGASTATATGTFILNFGGGNSLIGTFSVPAAQLFPTIGGGISSGVGSAVITAGTGTLLNATGSFPLLTGSATATGATTSSFVLQGSGDVIAPNFVPGPGGTGLRFVTVTPCRIADTRNAIGPFGGPVLAGAQPREFNIPASACTIPNTARAYSLNVTVVPSGPLSYVTLFPTGQAQPFVSTLNSFDGRIKANAAIVPAGTNGSVSVFATDQTHIVLDINGYFLPAGTEQNLVFFPVTPCRVADTRNPTSPFGAPLLAAGQSRDFQIAGAVCGVPIEARAYALNMTAVPSAALTFLTVWPAGQQRPGVSTLNAPTGTVVANAAIVPTGANGAISVFATDNTHLVIDINGYFAPPSAAGGLQFYTLNPCRISDTRNAAGPLGGPRLAAGQGRTFNVLQSPCQVPTGSRAYSLNATVVPPAALDYLTLWPAGQTQPLVSTLNAFDGSVMANAALLPAGSDGSVAAFGPQATDLVLDINGYFAP